ncbi:hypothetical protein FRB94_001427 [Tulasnella sp. JGI-2019a]|nr:hypothetical protein FRB94_001427 [Tulasnella sp. JGI-2019a]KAG9037955.1 hypothetical protein FRB95_003348 [Tulasnella sp. JGI-2019a]
MSISPMNVSFVNGMLTGRATDNTYVVTGNLTPNRNRWTAPNGNNLQGTLRFMKWDSLLQDTNGFSVERDQDNKLIVRFTINGIIVGTWNQGNNNPYKGSLGAGAANWVRNQTPSALSYSIMPSMD